MATVPNVSAPQIATSLQDVGRAPSGLLISLSPLSAEGLQTMLANLATAFPEQAVLVATPDALPNSETPNVRVVPYIPAAPAGGAWTLTAADFVNTYKLMQEHKATACLLLGAEAQSLQAETLRGLADVVLTGRADLATPHYELGPRDGLVNSAILYPVTRALYGTRSRYPLAVDLAYSMRMGERLAATAQRCTAAGQNGALVWPVAEAAAAGYLVAEEPGGARRLPQPDVPDLNSLLAQVAGSLFADVDAKASLWQRARLAYPPRAAAHMEDAEGATAGSAAGAEVADVQPMLDSFRLAYTNLHEIWSLVLPPNSLLGLKKLSGMPPGSFRMPDALWARIVYDFMLAYRLRTLNRGHLLGALTPLYLAWVASHLLLASSGAAGEHMAPERHIEALAVAFEADKPYLVSRWRWPDRFNP